MIYSGKMQLKKKMAGLSCFILKLSALPDDTRKEYPKREGRLK
jgi:hypothetical protein